MLPDPMVLMKILAMAALPLTAAGILRKMLWGWLLGIILSIITFTVLTWYLPMGVMDAVLSGPVLLLLLIGRYPDTKISGYEYARAGFATKAR